ncbi:MAG: TetR/AcrR family transcriptional regulator [Candidatus Marinimicrobia bacterium]|jgi:TetR/AcrR family transcriptional regulator, repressor of fatR-cypB operon|nr:TetR/AcrR family transcriptional regulator [Candidatus Neomarinimicrobiota bacterium]MBT4419973.1 TetR/AcrR family transcriptional regulator [Candidatus Neomarinimicrobiota bacterium]MBT5465179.1 TetR/AcrR family transcriptional regulator [Candidatus Neomarinimicrobiota bacterium]MBT7831135.1 TetR/AcrR family transcriptional regulator [Candidatus Neomarinimicrobiota bacterium]
MNIPRHYTGMMPKRDDIFSSALKLLVERGEQATSMKLIAQEAGCGIGTMYNYFPSKEDLLNRLYLRIKTEGIEQILNGLDSKMPVKQQFTQAWLNAIRYALSDPYKHKFIEAYGHSPIIDADVSIKIMSMLQPIVAMFEKGIAEGIIKDMDILQLVVFTQGGINASLMQQPEIDKKGIDIIIQMAWDAVKQ